jgi:hypothetical protein
MVGSWIYWYWSFSWGVCFCLNLVLCQVLRFDIVGGRFEVFWCRVSFRLLVCGGGLLLLVFLSSWVCLCWCWALVSASLLVFFFFSVCLVFEDRHPLNLVIKKCLWLFFYDLNFERELLDYFSILFTSQFADDSFCTLN